MNQTDLQKISKATATLRLVDIVLFDSKFQRYSETSPVLQPDNKQMLKRVVSYQFSKLEGDAELFLVKLDLGIRMCGPDAEGKDEPNVLFEIEAGFVALYGVSGKVENECYELFAEHNGVHIIWPFWRQHVFDLVHRAQLPRIEIPLKAGIPQPAVTSEK